MSNLTDVQKEVLRRYEVVKLQISELEAEAAAIKEEIVPIFPKDAKIQLDSGVLSFVNRPKWTYSAEVKDLEEGLKERKAQEQATGIAEKADVFILEYRKDKPKDDEENI